MSRLSDLDGSLWDAVAQNNAAVVRQAIRNGANVNCFLRQPRSPTVVDTPLILACEAGFDGIVRILLDAGADARWKDSEGWTGNVGGLPVRTLVNRRNVAQS